MKKIENSKTLKEIKKANGSTILVGQVYLGIDKITKKRRNTTIRATTIKQWERKAQQAKREFEENGFTTFKDSPSLTLFSELAEEWLNTYSDTLKVNTLISTKSYINNYIIPSFGKYNIVDITSRTICVVVKRWAINADTSPIVNGRREIGKGKDYVNALNILRKIFDYGFDLNLIEVNPAIGVTAPRPQKREIVKKLKYFDNVQLKIWLKYLDDLEQTNEKIFEVNLYRLLLDTGIRIGEALALNWSDVNLKKQVITISKTAVNGKIQNSTKSSKSRDIYISTQTVQRLKKWKQIQASYYKTISLNQDRLLFPSSSLSPSRQNMYYNRLVVHFKKAGLPNIGLHGFRHTHATMLLNNGADYKEIQDRLGHASISTTMDTYSHLSKNKAKETAELFNKSLQNL